MIDVNHNAMNEKSCSNQIKMFEGVVEKNQMIEGDLSSRGNPKKEYIFVDRLKKVQLVI